MKNANEQIRLRIKFKKDGLMRFIGHLDMMRFFQKLIRRSGLDIAYSEGFHPHQLMTFANPLGVGLCSQAEYMDIVMNSVTSQEQIIETLNKESVEGVTILAARRLPTDTINAMASVSRADYGILLKDMAYDGNFDLKPLFTAYFERESVLAEKKTKKGTKLIDMKKSVHEYRAEGREVFLSVNAGSAENIRPEFVLEQVFEYAGLELLEHSYQITRLEQYDEKGLTLLEEGEEF